MRVVHSCSASLQLALIFRSGSGRSPLSLLLASEARHSSMRGGGGLSAGGCTAALSTNGSTSARGSTDPTELGLTSSMLRVYQYARAMPEGGEEDEEEHEAGDAYCFRRRRPDDGDPHHDMGLLTLIPRSTYPGLDVHLPCLPHSRLGEPKRPVRTRAARRRRSGWRSRS